MKIGIVTQPLGSNVGGIIQNFALQTFLRNNGYDVVTFDYKPNTKLQLKEKVKRLIRNFLKKGLNILFKRHYRLISLGSYRSKYAKEFINKYIIASTPIKSYNDLSLEGFDVIIVGSDQVWRPKYNFELDNMFLAFVPDDIVKIGYAVSFGVSKWEYNEIQAEMACKQIKRFRAISVRENSGISLISNYLKSDATKVLDPTLLLKSEIYRNIVKHIKVSKALYIGGYFLNYHPNENDMFNNLKKLLNLPLKMYSLSHVDIYKWIVLIRDAEYIVTDSFHGTVFSILFHKPFISVINKERGAARILDLLRPLELEYRIISDSVNYEIDYLNSVLSRSINWKDVDNRLDKERIKSIQWIQRALITK